MTNYRWVVCALLFFATTVNYIDRQVLSVLKPMLERELNWSEADYGWIVFAFQMAYAIMMPIALSVARFAAEAFSRNPGQDRFSTPRLTQASCLAVLYGASAGGMATPAGVPFNPITISLSELLTGYSVTFAQWTLTGVILTLATIPVYYAALAELTVASWHRDFGSPTIPSNER